MTNPVYVGSVEMFCAGTEVCSDTQIFIRCELISRIVAIRNFSASTRVSGVATNDKRDSPLREMTGEPGAGDDWL